MLTARPVLAGGDEQVGLAAEEGGNLEDIDGFGGDFAMGGLVHVGEDGQAGVFGDAAEDARALFEAGAAKALDAGAVGLVVAGFEDVGNAEIGGDALDGFGDGARMGLGLDDAGTGDRGRAGPRPLARARFQTSGSRGRLYSGVAVGRRP